MLIDGLSFWHYKIPPWGPKSSLLITLSLHPSLPLILDVFRISQAAVSSITTFTMAKTLFFLALVAATFFIAEASRSGDSLLTVPVKLEVDVNNKLNINVDLNIDISAGKVHKLVHCAKHKLTTIGPIDVKVNVLEILNVDVSLINKKGKLVKVKLSLHLLKLVHIIAGVKHLALTLVEDLAEGVVRIFCGPILVAKITL